MKSFPRHLHYTDAASQRRRCWLEQNPIDWNKLGLLPAIVQDALTRQVLMQGYMNAEALEQSLASGKVTFYSRSRQRLWCKGESSGNWLHICELALDCDCDSLLILARPAGPTCHLGSRSCFSPEQTLGREGPPSLGAGWLGELENIIGQRQTGKHKDSYTAKLLSQGLRRMAQKVGEEGVEVALAAVEWGRLRQTPGQAQGRAGDSAEPVESLGAARGELAGEVADLLFHLLVLLQACGLRLQDAIAVLEQRHQAAPKEMAKEVPGEVPREVPRGGDHVSVCSSAAVETAVSGAFQESLQRLLGRARPHIQQLRPYASARLHSSAEELQHSILLNANENPYAPPSGLAEPHYSNRYPEPQPHSLRQALGQLYGMTAEQVLVGRGSDEAIDLLIRAFCAEQDAIAICSPTFGMYRSYAEIQGCRVIDLPLDIAPLEGRKGKLYRAQPPLAALRQLLSGFCDRLPKILFLPSPLAPLGCPISTKTLLELLRLCARRDVLLVVDEAYAEFAQALQGGQASLSCVAQLGVYPNLVVLRTLSKAYSLAGERIGCLLAAPQLVRLLRLVQAPYPVPSSISHYVCALLENHEAVQTMNAQLDELCRQQRKLLAELQSLAYVRRVFCSAANFVMMQVAPADCQPLLELCQRHKLALRDFSTSLEGGIRISVGTAAQMQELYKILQQYRGKT